MLFGMLGTGITGSGIIGSGITGSGVTGSGVTGSDVTGPVVIGSGPGVKGPVAIGSSASGTGGAAGSVCTIVSFTAPSSSVSVVAIQEAKKPIDKTSVIREINNRNVTDPFPFEFMEL
jgi:hypothetical protein